MKKCKRNKKQNLVRNLIRRLNRNNPNYLTSFKSPVRYYVSVTPAIRIYQKTILSLIEDMKVKF